MKSTVRLGLALLLASPMLVPAQQATPAPTPSPTPAAGGPPAAPRDKGDPLARSRNEPSREEQARTKTGKGAAPGKDQPAIKGGFRSETFAGLELRSLGPALTSGRITDLAVDSKNARRWFVASADGGVWRTVNGGTTFQPVFDGEASHSIGCVTIDPHDSFVVWVGSGENNSQRVVGYGDGVYRSEDGGETWKNTGLKSSEHISKILVDPRDSRVVWVAAQGPLWGPGGDRGLYKTSDGGKTWTASLSISENTGVTDVAMDPRDPDVLYAAAYQRRRHVFTLIDGGPESAIYKSVNGGATWRKITTGLPKEEMGRIGLAVSPAAPDVVYAVIEAANKAGGFFRSVNRGETWEKRGDYVPGSPQYYNEIFADPKERDRVYSMDVWIQVTDDGGKTFHKLGEPSKHPDNHVLWVDPADTSHYIAGCDGGIYESFDRAATWRFAANLPVTQFYRVSVDESTPVYNLFGGTQDNFSLGGPSRTRNIHGIANSDWFVTEGGDGFQSQIDPLDPNTVYAEAQYGVLTRFDRKTGESLVIAPQSRPGEPPLRWNWDSPLIISPHSHTRLYFAAQKVFRSDDRGNTWKAVSGDLTRQIDRNKLKVMGRVWPADAVAKNVSTSFYGNIVSLAESPLREGLLYVGTDDGLIHVTEDGGSTWRKASPVPGVPDLSYVSRLTPSPYDAATLYAAFDNHKNADFKPYAAKSTDGGRSWTSIAGDLPARGSVWVVIEDPGEKDLLFAGTEFGLYFTRDGGRRWIKLTGGFPNVAVRDLTVQKREGDLGRDVRARVLRAGRPDAPAAGDAGRARRRGGALPRPAAAPLHAGGAARDSRQGVPGRFLFHRPESPLRRRLHLVPQRRDQVAQENPAGPGEGPHQGGEGSRLPDSGSLPCRGAGGGAGDPSDRDRRRGPGRAAAEGTRDGGHPSDRLGPALPAGDPHIAQARRSRSVLRSAFGSDGRTRPVHGFPREGRAGPVDSALAAAGLRGARRVRDPGGGPRESPRVRAQGREAPARGRGGRRISGRNAQPPRAHQAVSPGHPRGDPVAPGRRPIRRGAPGGHRDRSKGRRGPRGAKRAHPSGDRGPRRVDRQRPMECDIRPDRDEPGGLCIRGRGVQERARKTPPASLGRLEEDRRRHGGLRRPVDARPSSALEARVRRGGGRPRRFRTSREETRSTSSPSPGREANGRFQRREEAFPVGEKTARSSSVVHGSRLDNTDQSHILMHMRTTLILDDNLLERARSLTGLKEKTAMVHAGLEALIARESARRLAALGASEKRLRRVPRRRLRQIRRTPL